MSECTHKNEVDNKLEEFLERRGFSLIKNVV